MSMKYSIVSTNGRITIPVTIRKKLKIRAGIKVAFLEQEGKLKVEPIDKDYFRRLADILGTKGKAVRALLEERRR